MPSSDVLHGARLVRDPAAILPVTPSVGESGGWGSAGGACPAHGAAEREALCAEAYRSGFEAGEQRGGERLAHVWQSLSTAVDEMEGERKRMVAPLREELTRLVLAMTEKLLRRAVELDPETARRTVTAALEAVGGARTVEIHLHPEDRELLETEVAAWRQGPPERERVTLIADAGVGRGGCRVVTASLTIDATLEGLLERFAEGLGDWAPEAQEVADAA
ncbi:MAG: hypothetical protein KAY32_00835 [Candidatus Eisenbacteria sp.]|nr:hypothetical protein [Candidatus Eisenbacteria bacterium]